MMTRKKGRRSEWMRLAPALVVACALAGCGGEGDTPVEDTVDNVEQGLEETGEKIEEGLEEAGDEIQDAGEKLKDETEDLVDETKGG